MARPPYMTTSSLRGDAVGGASAALGGLPLELIYGPIAFSALGAASAQLGVQAAIWACALCGVLALVFRTTPGMIYGSRAPAAFVLATLGAALMQHPQVAASSHPAETVVALIFLCVCGSGLLQLLFGLVRIGTALKFTPYPVLSGLMAGAAILMVVASLRPVLGIADGTPWSDTPGAWHPASLAVAAVTFGLCLRPPRRLKRVPFILTALAAGTLTHYALAAVLGAGHLGAVLGASEVQFPAAPLWQYLHAGNAALILELLPTLLPYALAIAAIGSLESLTCLPPIEAAAGTRADGDQELRAQGLANLCIGLLGGTPAIGNFSRVTTNLMSGGLTRRSTLCYSLAMALLALFAGAGIQWLPRAAIAGGALFFAYAMIDDTTRRLAVRLLAGREAGRDAGNAAQQRLQLANFAVIVLVAVVAVFGDMVKAAGIGVIAAMFLFVLSNAKPLVRRTFTGERAHSLRVRTPEANAVLRQHGKDVVVIEMEGILFFGTAERLIRVVAEMEPGVVAVIFDMQRVRDTDSTGARAVQQAARTLASRGATLMIAGANRAVETALRAFAADNAIADECWHVDLDQALEAAEDALLARHGFAHAESVLQLGQTTLAANLTPAEVEVLRAHLIEHEVGGTATLFSAGDGGDSLYVAANGLVNILVPVKRGARKRLASFAPGVIFGEMAFIEGSRRSADAEAAGCSIVWEFPRSRLEAIEREHPAVAHKIMANLARSLSDRLRVTTRALRLSWK